MPFGGLPLAVLVVGVSPGDSLGADGPLADSPALPSLAVCRDDRSVVGGDLPVVWREGRPVVWREGRSVVGAAPRLVVVRVVLSGVVVDAVLLVGPDALVVDDLKGVVVETVRSLVFRRFVGPDPPVADVPFGADVGATARDHSSPSLPVAGPEIDESAAETTDPSDESPASSASPADGPNPAPNRRTTATAATVRCRRRRPERRLSPPAIFLGCISFPKVYAYILRNIWGNPPGASSLHF